MIVQGSVFLRSARSFINMLPNLLEQDGYFEEVEKKGWFFYPSVCLSLSFGLWIKEKKKKNSSHRAMDYKSIKGRMLNLLCCQVDGLPLVLMSRYIFIPSMAANT